MLLILDIEGQEFPLRCDPTGAPLTVAKLAASLPMNIDLHCPKIAGSHIYWGAPFVAPLESTQDVMRLPDGAFFFWPERQILEVAYAPLQAETASVTLLGRCEGDLSVLSAIGRRVSEEQGVLPIYATLRAAAPQVAALPAPAVTARLRAARDALWAECPAEIETMLASRAIMHPVGPLVFALVEARGLHEILWWQYMAHRDGKAGDWAAAAALSTGKAATRLRDFCHLRDSAAALFLAAEELTLRSAAVEALFEEAILIAGRLANWLDFLTPWHTMNEAVRAVLDRPT
jgi:hypothetical protein